MLDINTNDKDPEEKKEASEKIVEAPITAVADNSLPDNNLDAKLQETSEV